MSMGPTPYQRGYDDAMNANLEARTSRHIEDVKVLKRRWYNLMQARPNGFGLAPHGKGWALKINTALEPAGDVPREIDGIPLIVEHVGTVTAAST